MAAKTVGERLFGQYWTDRLDAVGHGTDPCSVCPYGTEVMEPCGEHGIGLRGTGRWECSHEKEGTTPQACLKREALGNAGDDMNHEAIVRLAEGWIRTAPDSVRGDCLRLGFQAAAEYNVGLANDHTDPRWHPITLEAMKEALVSMGMADDCDD